MNFYVLCRRNGSSSLATRFLPSADAATGEAPRCAVCGLATGMRPLQPPFRLEIEGWLNRWGDVASFVGDQVLFSETFLRTYDAAQLTGLSSTLPLESLHVNRRSRKLGPPPVYRIGVVPRSHATLDVVASGRVSGPGPTCRECRIGGTVRRIARVVLEPSTWSGEDLFIARGLPGVLLTTERLKRAWDAHALYGAQFIPAEEWSEDFYPNELQ